MEERASFKMLRGETGSVKFSEDVKLNASKALAGRLPRITRYMHENFSRKLTLNEIANRENLSVFYLSHAIRETTGLCFQDLLGFIRAKESEKLLLGTNRKISMISTECGFSAVRYYVKHFEKWYDMTPTAYRKAYAGQVGSPERFPNYDNSIFHEFINDSKPESNVFIIDIAECLPGNRQKALFPENMFEKDVMKAAARPFNLFKNLNEHVLFSNHMCMVSTSAESPADISNLSVLIYNCDADFLKKLAWVPGRENFLDCLKAYDNEVEIILKCMGISGVFKAIRYRMTKQNVISAFEDFSKAKVTLNKRQALLNSWSTLPNIEAGELVASESLNLRFKLRGLSAELILIDRK